MKFWRATIHASYINEPLVMDRMTMERTETA